MSFLRSYYAWLIFLVPFIFLSWLIYRRWKVKLMENHFSYQFKKVHMNKRMSLIQVILISLGILFSILALMGPKNGYRWEKVETKGVDIVISLDISKSMDVRDIPPSRLKRSKLAIAELLGAAEGDRFGLVTFAGEAVKNSPLSQDYDALKIFLDEIDTSLIAYQGSNLNDALTKSLENFNEENQKARAIILISDGENHQDSLRETINKIKQKKVAIHTFAIGKREGAPIPGNDGFKKDDRGDTVISKVNTRPLIEIADATGGTFTHVQGNLMDLNNVYQIIKGGVDNISISQGRRKVPLDGYQIPLIVAIVLLFIDLFISRTSYTLYGIVFYFIISVPVSEAGILDFFLDKNSRSYIEKKFENGERETESNIADGERTAKEYDRLGHFYYRQEKYPEAIKSFEKSGNLYNLGNAHFLNGDSEKAITSYEKHLKKFPNDKDAKHNLELARKNKQKNKKQDQDDKNQDKKNEKKQDQKKEEKNKKENQQDQKNQEQNKQSEKNKEENQQKENNKNDKNEKEEQKKEGKKNKDDKKEEKSAQSSNNQKKKNQDEKMSYKSKVLLNQLNDSRKKYQKMKNLRKQPRRGGHNGRDW